MKDLICKVCSSHHFNKITDTEYQCKHCGFTMLTQSDEIDKKKVSLIEAYDKLNIGDYVEAEERFSYILNNNPKDYEALWGKIVSHYGIVFVNSDGNIFPTFHDFSKECFLDNKLYKEFLKLVPNNKVDIYKTIACEIEDLRSKYYNITLTEKDYDIFISFKQTDENNNKTLDYYEALKLYTYLINKGYRVFFSPITLQNKIGSEYEPFIYHALRTSKVLIVYGQKEEYFESIWVKNEWARYQKMIETNQKEDGSLIVCIENMNAYDLPSRIRSLQVIDFTDNKEAYETLDRNIKRIISKDKLLVDNKNMQIEIDIEKIFNLKFEKKGKYIYFGTYPQTIKSKDVKIEKSINYNNREYFVGSDDNVYVKIEAMPENSGYSFSNYEKVIDGKEYYFKVEPVKWRIIKHKIGEAILFTDAILDCHMFDLEEDVYEISALKRYLNTDIYDEMFSKEQKMRIETNELGKLYPLNIEEITKSSYGFNKNEKYFDSARRKKVTDYSIARGVEYNTSEEYARNGNYWLRNKSSDGCISSVDYKGYAYCSTEAAISLGLAFALKINLKKL